MNRGEYDPNDNEYAPLYEKYVLNPKPDADSDKGEKHFEYISKINRGKEVGSIPSKRK